MSQKEDRNEDTKRTNKKGIIIAIIIMSIIAVSIIITVVMNMRFVAYEIEEIANFDYFTLYKNEKYGIIDKQGNVIVEPEYDMVAIPNPSKAVFICYYEYNSQNNEYKTKVFNEKKEQIFLEYEEVLPLMFQDSTAKVPYEKSILKYKQDGKYGIMDFTGKKITNAEYDTIESLLYKEGYLTIGKEGKNGVIDGNGKKIIDIQYDTITADGYYKEDSKYKLAGFIIGNKTETGYQYGYINYKGDILLEPQYNEVDRVTEIADNEKNVYIVAFKNGQAGIFKNDKMIVEHQYEDIEYNSKNNIFVVQKYSKQGVISQEGEKILEPQYEYIYISNNKITAQNESETYLFDIQGNKEENINDTDIISTENEKYFITITKDEKYGVVNQNKETIIANDYSYLEYIFADYFIATNNSKIGVINSLNEEIIPFKYDVIQKIENSNVLQAILTGNNTTELYNEKMEKIISMNKAMVYNSENYIKIISEDDFCYFDKKGYVIENTDILENSLFACKNEGKWGFKDSLGEIKITPQYDMVTEFNTYGFAGIKKDDKWGVINTNGEILLEPSYNISWHDPQFIGKYCKVNFGYGLDYYTDDLS